MAETSPGHFKSSFCFLEVVNNPTLSVGAIALKTGAEVTDGHQVRAALVQLGIYLRSFKRGCGWQDVCVMSRRRRGSDWIVLYLKLFESNHDW